MDSYIGEIRIFAGSYAPQGWALCDGSLLQIRSYPVLFSILGTNYGGDGQNTFALPDLRGRAPMHQGQGPGLTNRPIGSAGGSAQVTLRETQMPAHTHIPACQSVTNGSASPENAIWTKTFGRFGQPAYATQPNQAMSAQAIGIAGSSQPHNNMQPYLSMNFIISLEGDFPPHG